MGVIGSHESAGNMGNKWMDLAQISPFLYGLLTQQGFKLCHSC